MLKNILVSTTAVAALVTGMVAMAGQADGQAPVDHSGFYLRGEAGYGMDQVSKKFKADKSYSLLHGAVDGAVVGTSKNDLNGFAGRIAAGYAFNQYIGVEGGFAYLPTLKETTKGTLKNVTRRFDGIPVNFKNATFNGQLKESFYAFDLMAKGTLPFDNDTFYAFGAAGVALVHQKVTTTAGVAGTVTTGVVPSFSGNINKSVKTSKSKSFVRPKIEAGLGYNINENIAVDVAYSRIFGKGSVSDVAKSGDFTKYLPDFNTVTVGLTYKF
jgi:opacity protein-like surface antigen